MDIYEKKKFAKISFKFQTKLSSLVAELVNNFIKPAKHDIFNTLTSKLEKTFDRVLSTGQPKFLVNGFDLEAKFFNNI